MELERERIIEIVVSVLVVAGFVALLIGIGMTYERDELTGEGGLALVGAITFFVVIMWIVGYGLANVLYED